MRSQEIKEVIKNSGVRQWQIAEYLGMNEFSLSRKLRKDIKEEDFLKIQNAVEEIKKER